MVEFALVAVVLFALVFGLIEAGFLVRARNSVTSTVSEATRRGAVAAESPSADYQILNQLRARGLLTAAEVDLVVVYKADEASQQPPESCMSGIGVPGTCNVYERDDFDQPESAFGCTDSGLDANWCPTEREVEVSEFGYIGVAIQARYSGVTGLFGEVSLASHAVLPLEGSGS